MKKRKYWHRQYVKRIEEIIHSGEPYMFIDKWLLYGVIILALFLSLLVFNKINKNFVVSESSEFDNITQNVTQSNKILKIVFFDVTQGDAALILTPSRINFLIDTGPGKGMVIQESEPGVLVTEIDAGSDVIVPYLKENNLSLDGILITHPHSDHFGGCLSILKLGYIPKWFIDNGVETSHPEYYQLLQLVSQHKINYKTAAPQQKLNIDPELEVEILAPVQKYSLENVDRAVNNSSIVLKITYRNFSVLFTGDIEVFAEMDLLEYKDKLKSTVLKIPHHGSFTSSSEPFLDKVSPEVAIISCGRGNPFGHPHQDTIDKLVERKIKIYRTDQNGNITVITDGETYKIFTEREY